MFLSLTSGPQLKKQTHLQHKSNHNNKSTKITHQVQNSLCFPKTKPQNTGEHPLCFSIQVSVEQV